jgi:hypothetical protein
MYFWCMNNLFNGTSCKLAPARDYDFWLSDDLNVARSEDLGKFNKKWNFGGTALHELVNHFHYLGNEEDNTGLQFHYNLPRSSIEHYGGVKNEWSEEEKNRLEELRSKTGRKK